MLSSEDNPIGPYEQMAIEELATPSLPLPQQQQHSVLLHQQQGPPPLLRSDGSAPMAGRGSALYSNNETLIPLGAQARQAQQQLPPSAALLPGQPHFGSQQQPSMHQQQQQLLPPQLPAWQESAYSDLAAAMRMGGSGSMMNMEMEQQQPLPLPMAGRVSSAAAAAVAAMKMTAGLGHGQASYYPGVVSADKMRLFQQQQQSALGASGMAASHQHDGSRVRVPYNSNETALSDPRAYDIHGGASVGMGPALGGAGNHYHGNCGGVAVAAVPEAGDGCAGWCSGGEIDAELDMLMQESGSSTVYHTGNNPASLERICFKLHNVHPNKLPRDLINTMGSWLAAARTEVVQGAVRPGCTQLILDVYVQGPNPADLEIEESPAAPPAPPPPPPGELPQPAEAAPWMDSKATSRGDKGRVLGGLLPSENERAQMEASAAGAEALRPMETSSRGSGASTSAEGGGGASDGYGRRPVEGGEGGVDGNAEHLSSHVMQGGDVHAATAVFKKLLGSRAVQSMSVTINNQMLTLSNREMGRHVADVRGTMAGMDTPLLLSVTPVAVVAGASCEVKVIGSHLTAAGRRPQIRCRGDHVACSVVLPPSGSFHRLQPYACSPLVGQLIAKTLPGSHRAEAAVDCVMLDVQLQEVPDAGLMMLEWEASRSAGGVAISDWLPLVSVPDAAMAMEINTHVAGVVKDGKRQAQEQATSRLHSFLTDLGMVFDYVTRVGQRTLLPLSTFMASEQRGVADPDDSNDDECPPEAAPGGLVPAPYGGGKDQGLPLQSPGGVPPEAPQVLEHDSHTDLMGRPRMSKKHFSRVAALAPSLLAFAADSGMAAVMSWLMDFMLEHVHFGDLAAVFKSVEAVGSGAAAQGGLPLLHRGVRSGNPRAVQMLLHRAASHDLACNLAQTTGPYGITPLHLAALQPFHTGMLQAIGCADPVVAELWVTVTDAAGRTPAMYLRRQLALSACTANALGGGAAAAPSQPRSSTPDSATGYRSWGSEDPVDAVVAEAAGGAAGDGRSMKVTTELSTYNAGGPQLSHAPPQPSYASSDAGSASSARGSALAEDVDVVEGGHRGEGEAGATVSQLVDSVEDFRERRGLRQRGGRLADMAFLTMEHEVLDGEGGGAAVAVGVLAGTPPPAAQPGADGRGIAPGVPDYVQRHPQLQPQRFEDAAAAVVAGAVPVVGADGSTLGQENGLAPLQAQGSGAIRASWWAVLRRGASTTATPEDPAVVRTATAAAKTAAAEASGRAPGRDSAPHFKEIGGAMPVSGDLTEDWLTQGRGLRTHRKQPGEQQQQEGTWGGGSNGPSEGADQTSSQVSSTQLQAGRALGLIAAVVQALTILSSGARRVWAALRDLAAADVSAGAQAVMVVVAVVVLLIAGVLAAGGQGGEGMGA